MLDNAEWHDYPTTLVGFAGTVFALILAARGIRLSQGVPKEGKSLTEREARYRFIDSAAVTFELLASALFALFATIPQRSVFFVGFTLFLAAAGIGVVIATVVIFFQAIDEAKWNGFDWFWMAASILPFGCYVVTAIIWLDWPWRHLPPVVLVAVATWLAISGSMQAIWWYVSVWRKEDVQSSLQPTNH